MSRCTDVYGNAVKELKEGAVVQDDVAIFVVGKINTKCRDWLVVMDKNRPYKIKNEDDPMASCVRAGNYAVRVSSLEFAERSCFMNE